MTTQTDTRASSGISFEPLLSKQGSGSSAAQSGVTKIAGRVMIDVLSSPGFAYVDALQSGVLFGLIKTALASGTTAISRTEALRQAHLLGRTSRERAEEALETLSSAELLVVTESEVSIPALTAAVLAQDAERTRRSQGWARRRSVDGAMTFDAAPASVSQSSAAPAAPAAPAPAPASTVTGAVILQSADAQGAQDGHEVALEMVAQDDGADLISDDDLMGACTQDGGDKSTDEFTLTPDADDAPTTGPQTFVLEVDGGGSEDSEVVAEITAKSGDVVQVSRGYAKWLQSTCPNVDALVQVQKAAAWCTEHRSRRKTVNGMGTFLLGWLNRADATAARNQGARRSNAGAFGTGSAAPLTDGAPAGGDDGADIDDLNELIAMQAGAASANGAEQKVAA